MANSSFGITPMKIANSLKAVADMGGATSGIGTPTNYASANSLRTRLAAINGAYYTTAKLDQLTLNDMVYALRMLDDRTTIADYLPASTA